jgi:hypothetical protein
MLSEGRGTERNGCALTLFLVGCSMLTCVGAFVTVQALVGWLT